MWKMSAMMEKISFDSAKHRKSELWLAIELGNIVLVDRILKCGYHVCETYLSRQTPLMFAVEKGRTECLPTLLDVGAHIDSVDAFGMSSVMIAAKKGHLDCLRLLVNAGASLHFRDIRGRTALHIAVEENRCECTQYLIEAGADIHQYDSNGKSALMVANHVNCEKCLQSLVQAGASVDEFNKSGKIHLMIAAEKDSLVLPALIKLGAKIDVSDSRGRTSTVYAAREGRVNSHLQLIQAGANVNLADYRGQTALMIAAEAGHVECVECLAKGGAKLEQQDTNGRTALMLAAAKGHHDVLRVLLQYGEQCKDLQCKNNKTALVYALFGFHDEFVELLKGRVQYPVGFIDTGRYKFPYRISHIPVTNIQRPKTYMEEIVNNYQPDTSSKCLRVLLAAGANPNICDINDMSPLMYAAILDKTGELCKQLIEAGADVNYLIEKRSRTNILLPAACYGDVKSLRKIVESGASVNVAAGNGDTPLICLALKSGNPGIYDDIALLLDHGADVNARSKSGKTPLMFAARDQAGTDVMDLLISHGADVNAQSKSGKTPLMCVTSNPAGTDVMDLLISHGADVNAQSKSGKTPLMCVTSDPAGTDVMDLLISRGADVNKTDCQGYSALDYTLNCNGTLIKNARYLLENGAKPGFMSVGNIESLAVENKKFAFLLLLIKGKLEFPINLCDFCFILSLRDRKLLQAVVLEGVLPSYIFPNNRCYEDHISLLLETLDQGYLGIFKYLLSVGYLNIFKIHCDKLDVINWRSKRRFWSSMPEEKSFFKSLYSQPWPLVKLAFVVVSSNMGTGFERKDHIKNSGLPDRIQRMLLFQEPISKLCISCWDSIPVCFNPQDYENLPKPRPLLYYWPFGHDLTPCDCHECSQSGYTFISRLTR